MGQLALERAAAVIDLGTQAAAAQLGHERQHARLELGVVERDEDVEPFILGGDPGRLE